MSLADMSPAATLREFVHAPQVEDAGKHRQFGRETAGEVAGYTRISTAYTANFKPVPTGTPKQGQQHCRF